MFLTGNRQNRTGGKCGALADTVPSGFVQPSKVRTGFGLRTVGGLRLGWVDERSHT